MEGMKKLKGKNTSLGWNLIKGTIDALEDWLDSKLKVVSEAQRFRVASIDLKLEGKLDQMFMGIVSTGDKAWTHFSDEDNQTPDKLLEPKQHVLGLHQNGKSMEVRSSHVKTSKEKPSKVGGVAQLSSQTDKLCNATDHMSQAKSNLTPINDLYGIPSYQSA
ncbi:hypothetical protein J1N35_019553 [Gossypium stocksii]|uniref:Uncharacterized protein n=1 Tax=Gossypium stocksii TaxID=47602 RepID=A0A9D3VR59_9ROSI|nr:hypothetical protein J1N35_019553 [Gossypium stocksii]